MERSTVVDPESGKSVWMTTGSSSGTFLNKAQVGHPRLLLPTAYWLLSAAYCSTACPLLLCWCWPLPATVPCLPSGIPSPLVPPCTSLHCTAPSLS